MQISEKFNFVNSSDKNKMFDCLNTYGYFTYKARHAVIDAVRMFKNPPADYVKFVGNLKKKAEEGGYEFPDFKDITDDNRYFVCRLDGSPANSTSYENYTYKPCYFAKWEDCLDYIAEKKVYPPQFYKYITEREDWDIQPEEIYLDAAQMEELFQEYMQEINLLVTKLKRLKDDGKENTPEFSSFILKLNDLAPDLAKEFKAS